MENYGVLLRELYSGAEVIIWGAGIRGKRILDLLRKLDVPVAAFGDNAPEKWHTEISGLRCLSKKEVAEKEQDKKVVVISSPKDSGVYEELKRKFTKVYGGGGSFGVRTFINCQYA